MFELENFTCFHTQQFKNIDQLDRTYDVVVAKVSYEFEIDPVTGKTVLEFAQTQTPLTFADTFYGEPSQTSTQFESDFCLYKPKTDLVVNAIAYAPNDTPAQQLAVAVSIGDYQKSLALTGERYWVREIAGWSLSEPDPILSLPIRYEFAFGGGAVEDDHEGHQQNPVGIGYYPKSQLKQNGFKRILKAHQIYDPSHPIRDPAENVAPEGFGFMPRYFAQRARHSGTADAKWIGGWPQPQGRALFSGLYVNELMLKLTVREDPLPELYDVLTETMKTICCEANHIAALRRFEWTLLTRLGFAPDLFHDGNGNEINGEETYWLTPEEAVVPLAEADRFHALNKGVAVSGATLIDLREGSFVHQESLGQALKVTRLLIDNLLPEGIKSRQVLQQLQQFGLGS